MERLLESVIRYSRIFIYGDGEVGRLLRIFLHEQGIEATGFVVTNIPQRKKLMQIPVQCLGDITAESDDALFIVCMHKKWWNEASEKLQRKNYHYIVIDDALRKEILDTVLFKDIYEDVETGRYINTLLYHRVENLDTVYSLIVNKRNFEDQLSYIKANYQMLRCDESWDGVNKKSVALTFDDGYVDFYKNVYPLLQKYEIPATVFIATGNIGRDSMFWWDELECIIMRSVLPTRIRVCEKEYAITERTNRTEVLFDIHDRIINYKCRDRDREIESLRQQTEFKCANRDRYRTMNREEIYELSKSPFITIGAHTVSHILCDIEDSNVVRNEILRSKNELESIIDKEVKLFAYPNGNIGVDSRNILEELGFWRAFTCVNACIGHDDKKYDIPRCPVLNWEAVQNSKRFRGMWQTGKDV